VRGRDAQLPTDLLHERLNDFHPKSLAGGGIELRRQSRPAIQHTERIIAGPRRPESDSDVSLGVFRRIGDQLVDDESERNGQRRRDLGSRTLD
jgi:hypothetical protein